MTRALGAQLNYRVKAPVTRGRQARPEVCGARLHENTVVERREARGPDSKGPRTRLASVFGGRTQRPPGARKAPAPFGAPLPSLEGEQRGRDFANPGRTPPRQ